MEFNLSIVEGLRAGCLTTNGFSLIRLLLRQAQDSL